MAARDGSERSSSPPEAGATRRHPAPWTPARPDRQRRPGLLRARDQLPGVSIIVSRRRRSSAAVIGSSDRAPGSGLEEETVPSARSSGGLACASGRRRLRQGFQTIVRLPFSSASLRRASPSTGAPGADGPSALAALSQSRRAARTTTASRSEEERPWQLRDPVSRRKRGWTPDIVPNRAKGNSIGPKGGLTVQAPRFLVHLRHTSGIETAS